MSITLIAFKKTTLLLAATILFVTVSGMCQSKLYVSGGITNISGGGLNVTLGEIDEGTFFKFDHHAFDVEYSSRLMGSFSILTGLSFLNAGYDVESRLFGSASALKVSYIALPIMARWNVGNKNIFFLDLGLAPFYLLNAHLEESIIQFNTLRVSEGNITPYSNRFYFGYKFQMCVPINRIILGLFYFAPVGGQTSLKGLDGHWGLNGQQSTYLLSGGYSNFQIYGIKAGVRIR
jgi:hypothetical protein